MELCNRERAAVKFPLQDLERIVERVYHDGEGEVDVVDPAVMGEIDGFEYVC